MQWALRQTRSLALCMSQKTADTVGLGDCADEVIERSVVQSKGTSAVAPSPDRLRTICLFFLSI